MFDSEVEEAATEEVVTSERSALQEADVTAGAAEGFAGCASQGGSSEVMTSRLGSGPPPPAGKWSTFDYSEPAPQKYSWTG